MGKNKREAKSTTFEVNSEAAWVVKALANAASDLGTRIPVSELVEKVGAEAAAQAWMALATFKEDSDTSKAINSLLYADNTSNKDARTQLSEFYGNRIKELVPKLEEEFTSLENLNILESGGQESENPIGDKSDYVVGELLKDEYLSGFLSATMLRNRSKRLTGIRNSRRSWEAAEASDLERIIQDGRIISYTDGKANLGYPGTSETWRTLGDIFSYSPFAQTIETAFKKDKKFSDLGIISAGAIAAGALVLLIPGVNLPSAAAAIAWQKAGSVLGATLITSKLAGNKFFNPNPVPKYTTNTVRIPTLGTPGDSSTSDTNETQTDSITAFIKPGWARADEVNGPSGTGGNASESYSDGPVFVNFEGSQHELWRAGDSDFAVVDTVTGVNLGAKPVSINYTMSYGGKSYTQTKNVSTESPTAEFKFGQFPMPNRGGKYGGDIAYAPIDFTISSPDAKIWSYTMGVEDHGLTYSGTMDITFFA